MKDLKANTFHSYIDIEVVLNAYMNGVFPMAESRNDEKIVWIEPKRRGTIPLNLFHTSKSLDRHIKKYNSTGTVLFIEYDLQRYTHRAVAMPFGPLLVEAIDINFQSHFKVVKRIR